MLFLFILIVDYSLCLSYARILTLSTTWINGEFLTLDHWTIILKMIEWINVGRADVARFSSKCYECKQLSSNWPFKITLWWRDTYLYTRACVCVCSQSIECLEWLNFRIFFFVINRNIEEKKRKIRRNSKEFLVL